MSRQVLTSDVNIPAAGYLSPARVLKKGTIVELSGPEITAITGAGGTVRATTARDQLGLSAAVSNGN